MGRLSLVVGVLSWFVLILAFAIGGLDPSPEQTPLLRAAGMGALVAAAVALCLAVVALRALVGEAGALRRLEVLSY